MRFLPFFAAIGLLLAPATAQATAVLGGSVVATGGAVEARFDYNGAAYTNELHMNLYLNGQQVIFNNQTSTVNSTVNLGTYAAGTELIFWIEVVSPASAHNLFYTGPGSRNADGIAHAIVTDGTDADLQAVASANGLNLTDLIARTSPQAGRTWVGFEDIFGGGDRDYEDLVFSFTNTVASNGVPEPGTLGLVGLAGLAALRRRRRS